MKMCKKGIAWILALMLVLSMAPSVFAAEGDESGETATEAFDISKSKEATQLRVYSYVITTKCRKAVGNGCSVRSG